MPAEKVRLCIDIDNVICRTDDVMRRVIQEITGGRVNLRYENVTNFKYEECVDRDGAKITHAEWDAVHQRFSQDDNLLALEPYEDVQHHLGRLSKRFAIHLATARLQIARRATIEWLETRGFHFVYDLHFLTHGEKHSALGDFAAAVEDDLDQAKAFAESGTDSFLLDHPWNQTDDLNPRLHRVADWEELTGHLLSLCPSNNGQESSHG